MLSPFFSERVKENADLLMNQTIGTANIRQAREERPREDDKKRGQRMQGGALYTPVKVIEHGCICEE